MVSVAVGIDEMSIKQKWILELKILINAETVNLIYEIRGNNLTLAKIIQTESGKAEEKGAERMTCLHVSSDLS